MKVIIPLGPPSVGKGTLVAKFLKGREEQYETLSVGNLLREEVKKQTKLGKRAKTYMDEGELAPDELIVEMVLGKIQHSQKNLFLDGFPRTVEQAKAMLEAGVKHDLVINLQVDEEVILQRTKDRIVCEKCGESYTKQNSYKRPKHEGVCDECGGKLVRRKDDMDEDVVRNRFKLYEEKTRPVLQVFAGVNVKICNIDGSSATASKEFDRLVIRN